MPTTRKAKIIIFIDIISNIIQQKRKKAINKDLIFISPRFIFFFRSIPYSRNIKNLFMAGRNVSVTHDALGTVRVMRTCGMMGEAIGFTAALCKKYGSYPREIYENYLGEFLEVLRRGQIIDK